MRRRRRGIVKRAADEGDEFQEKVEIFQEAAAEMEREVNDVEEEAALDLVMEEMEELVEKKVELLKEEDEKLEGVKIDLDGESLKETQAILGPENLILKVDLFSHFFT
ncbi:uncharacterized protein [Branchiostoma lanceolatum]|uniref:uncharacterized protein isoform X1 n=1 Tax=Branchiostoma lanceolatum TaxID=7740 RepID=UPI003451B8FF